MGGGGRPCSVSRHDERRCRRLGLGRICKYQLAFTCVCFPRFLDFVYVKKCKCHTVCLRPSTQLVLCHPMLFFFISPPAKPVWPPMHYVFFWGKKIQESSRTLGGRGRFPLTNYLFKHCAGFVVCCLPLSSDLNL